MNDVTIYFYISGVGIAGIFTYFFARILISRIERGKQRRLCGLTEIEAISTNSPNDDDDDTLFRKQGKERIKARFTITRKSINAFVCGIVLLLIALPFVGTVPTTGISLCIAVVTVLIGIASRPFLENFVAGMSLSFGKVARIGDVVEVEGHYGTVEDIKMTHTIIRRWDWVRHIVPNAAMIQKSFKNYTLNDMHRWVYVEFHVDYASDIEMVEEISVSVPQNSKYFNDVEPPQFWVVDFEAESVKCMLVAWATSPADGWALSVDIRKLLTKRLQEHNVITHTHHCNCFSITKSQADGRKKRASA